jgi:Tfp pilus assembly protein PilX
VDVVLASIVLIALVAMVVLRPLVTGERMEAREDARVAELEAAKEAKYREIRDAELDRRMGKLSEEDYRRVDRELRAEAIVILRELDELGGR